MKRSSSVILGAMFAASLAACSSSGDGYDEVCVEERTELRMDDAYCDPPRSGYHWYYIPGHQAVPPVGSKVSGGSNVRPASGSVVRGGFGGRAATGG